MYLWNDVRVDIVFTIYIWIAWICVHVDTIETVYVRLSTIILIHLIHYPYTSKLYCTHLYTYNILYMWFWQEKYFSKQSHLYVFKASVAKVWERRYIWCVICCFKDTNLTTYWRFWEAKDKFWTQAIDMPLTMSLIQEETRKEKDNSWSHIHYPKLWNLPSLAQL